MKKFENVYQDAALMRKVLLGEADEVEQKDLEKRLAECPDLRNVYEQLQSGETLKVAFGEYQKYSSKKAYQSFLQSIGQMESKGRKSRSRRVGWYAAAAVVTLAVALSFYMSNYGSIEEESRPLIQPGVQQAQLTLPDGSIIDVHKKEVNVIVDGVQVKYKEGVLSYKPTVTTQQHAEKNVDESPAKVHRYLASLMAEGLVEQDRGGTQYALGREAIHIGLAAMRQNDPVRMSEPALQHLRESLQVTSFVAVMGNMGPTIVRFEEPSLPITVNVRVGSVMSMLWSATGRAFFAFMEPQPEVEALLARELEAASPEHRRLLHASKPLEQLRSEIRAAGCAAIRDLNLPGISAVAAPLFDYHGHVVAVLCALGASGGFDPDPQGRIARAVCQEARSISASLGYRV